MELSGIIIGGASRAGKTMLGEKLCRKLGLTHVPVDAMVDAFAAVFPSNGIVHTSEDYLKVSSNLAPFLSKFLSSFPNLYERFVADSVYFEPEILVRDSELQSAELLFLGYPTCDPEEKLAAIRKYERPKDWTRNFSNEDILTFVQRYIRRSEYLRVECEKHSVRFVDTSTDIQDVLETECSRILEKFADNNQTQPTRFARG